VPFGSDVYTRQCDALPRARITARVHGRRIRLRWSAKARNGPAVATFTVQVKRGSALWRTLHGLSATTRRSTTLHGRAGSRYRFRVRATDALGRPGKYATTRKFKLRRHLRSNHSLK
jgi:hypothetical protein